MFSSLVPRILFWNVRVLDIHELMYVLHGSMTIDVALIFYRPGFFIFLFFWYYTIYCSNSLLHPVSLPCRGNVGPAGVGFVRFVHSTDGSRQQDTPVDEKIWKSAGYKGEKTCGRLRVLETLHVIFSEEWDCKVVPVTLLQIKKMLTLVVSLINKRLAKDKKLFIK